MAVWLRLTMLAWVTAVLAVMPVQAALACRDCCVAAKSQPTAHRSPSACCAHHKAPAATPSCCSQHTAVKASAPLGQPCSECPRCEQTRPAPLAPIPAGPQLLDLTAVAVFDAPLIDIALPSITASANNAPTVVSSPHQRCAQLCRWLT